MTRKTLSHAVVSLGLLCSAPVLGQELNVSVAPAREDDTLAEDLRAASLVRVVLGEETSTALDLVAAAKADYGRYLSILYENGYFGGTVSILVDGQEAAALSPFLTPEQISEISVVVNTGPEFTFSRTDITPLAPETELPEGFQVGEPARSALISQAGRRAIATWRNSGHAKAQLSGQSVRALHRDSALDVALDIEPGPKLTFGTLTVTGNEDVDTDRILAIAGLPEGQVYSTDTLSTVADRLSRTGAFRFAVIREAETPNPDGSLDMTVEIEEEKPRRLGFGAEVGTSDGITVSGQWFHRNFFGGAERLQFDAELTQRLEEDAELEYTVGATFVRPAAFGPDFDFRIALDISRETNDNFIEDIATFETGFDYRISDKLFLYGGVRVSVTRTDLQPEEREFLIFGTPVGAVYDNRNIPTDATEGYYLDAEVFPFVGREDADSGVRTTLDLRTYRQLAVEERLTLAARGQIGSVFGPESGAVPESLLFYSGGGGTVRGQPFESLGIVNGDVTSGGGGFAGLSLEARYSITDTIGIAGFYDYGYISASDIFNGGGDSHSGAGFGVRYATPVGPIRFDIGLPVSGDTDDGFQLYFGLGQAF